MRKYFKVCAKCGHVGRNRYYEGVFYKTANSAKEAAKIVRNCARVKHHHKDAILSVEEIDVNRYIMGLISLLDESYRICKNKKEQMLFWNEISEHVKDEKPLNNFQKKTEQPIKNIYYGKQKIKKPKKFFRLYTEMALEEVC